MNVRKVTGHHVLEIQVLCCHGVQVLEVYVRLLLIEVKLKNKGSKRGGPKLRSPRAKSSVSKKPGGKDWACTSASPTFPASPTPPAFNDRSGQMKKGDKYSRRDQEKGKGSDEVQGDGIAGKTDRD